MTDNPKKSEEETDYSFTTEHNVAGRTLDYQYEFRGKPCRRVPLASRDARKLAGWTMIKRDLVSASKWFQRMESMKGAATNTEESSLRNALLVAAFTFYGKCFRKAEGRGTVMAEGHLDPRFHELHQFMMRHRDTYAAHSGIGAPERGETVVAVPLTPDRAVPPALFVECVGLSSIDGLSSLQDGNLCTIEELFEHAVSVATARVEALREFVITEEILKKGENFWYGKPGQ